MPRRNLALGAVLVVTLLILFSDAPQVVGDDPPERFVPVEEGLLDTQTGLVWGYTLYNAGDFVGVGANGTWNSAADLALLCQSPEEGVEICNYTEFSNWFTGRDDDDWRLPTIDEMSAAYDAGISAYLDANPEPDFQPLTTGWYWSATQGKKSRGSATAYALKLGGTGESNNWRVGSILDAIPVRGGTAPEEPGGGPGNGKGKGKNK